MKIKLRLSNVNINGAKMFAKMAGKNYMHNDQSALYNHKKLICNNQELTQNMYQAITRKMFLKIFPNMK